ncbi:MAG: DUF2185 domain-containing protein [Bacteroidetes bacterium]|nr:DUF2185 domain-containing protein [Bacteroidota bacterium]
MRTKPYIDEPGNCEFVSLGSLLNGDDSFIDILIAPTGSAFVRDEESGKFVPLED